jgi:hypothetical protein
VFAEMIASRNEQKPSLARVSFNVLTPYFPDTVDLRLAFP